MILYVFSNFLVICAFNMSVTRYWCEQKFLFAMLVTISWFPSPGYHLLVSICDAGFRFMFFHLFSIGGTSTIFSTLHDSLWSGKDKGTESGGTIL